MQRQGLLFISQSCVTLRDPMDCSTPGFPVLHYLPEFAHTDVHRVSDAIQPSHPRSPPSPPAFNLSQHQGLFQWVVALHQGPKYWSFGISPSNETREEQSRNNSAALEQGPSSTSRNTRNNIFELFYRTKSPNKWKILAFFIPERRS